MLKPRRRSLVSFRRSPINAESAARIDLMQERIAGHARMRERERRELAQAQLDEIHRQQQQDHELHRITRGFSDPDLLHFARLGLIADPDEIDRDFGWFFENVSPASENTEDAEALEGAPAPKLTDPKVEERPDPDRVHGPENREAPDGSSSLLPGTREEIEEFRAMMRGTLRGVGGLARESVEGTADFIGALKDAVVHRATGDEDAREGRETIDQVGADLVSFFKEALENPEDIPGRVVDDVKERYRNLVDELDEADRLEADGQFEEAGEVKGRAIATALTEVVGYVGLVTGPGGLAVGSIKKVAKLSKNSVKKPKKDAVSTKVEEAHQGKLEPTGDPEPEDAALALKKRRAEQLRINAKAGRDYEVVVGDRNAADGSAVATHVTMVLPSGNRFVIDIVVTKPDGTTICIECKASATARLTNKQKDGFREMAEVGSYVAGKGKPADKVPGGMVFPPTKVVIDRKK